MTTPLIQTLAIVGPGLIGGSFSLALQAAKAVTRVIGYDRNPQNAAEALRLGVITEQAASYEQLADADVVFVAIPVCSIVDEVVALARHLKPGAIITDGGSVKEALIAPCESAMPDGVHFVGGHPISGTEHSGAAAAFATLFVGRRCILTPSRVSDPAAVALVKRLWELAGSEVLLMDPKVHDTVFAAVSHLPHMVAYTLVHAVDRSAEEEKNILDFSAGGFRDFTRIASSDPAMWRDIALMNRDALLAQLDRYAEEFNQLRERIASGDAQWVEQFFATSKRLRDGITAR